MDLAAALSLQLPALLVCGAFALAEGAWAQGSGAARKGCLALTDKVTICEPRSDEIERYFPSKKTSPPTVCHVAPEGVPMTLRPDAMTLDERICAFMLSIGAIGFNMNSAAWKSAKHIVASQRETKIPASLVVPDYPPMMYVSKDMGKAARYWPLYVKQLADGSRARYVIVELAPPWAGRPSEQFTEDQYLEMCKSHYASIIQTAQKALGVSFSSTTTTPPQRNLFILAHDAQKPGALLQGDSIRLEVWIGRFRTADGNKIPCQTFLLFQDLRLM